MNVFLEDTPGVAESLSPALCESLGALLPRLLGGGPNANPALRTLGVTSALSGEGVSTVAVHLAVAVATSTSLPVLLVDCDLERPTAHHRFGLHPAPGLADVLIGDEPFPELPIQPTGVADLSVLVAGEAGTDLPRAHGSTLLPTLLEKIPSLYRVVIFDLPATSRGPFTARLARLLEAILLVVEAERSRWEEVQRQRDLLMQVGARLFGAVLNKQRQYIPSWLRRLL
jgi:Mrp family chromosome partitioning ATPase